MPEEKICEEDYQRYQLRFLLVFHALDQRFANQTMKIILQWMPVRRSHIHDFGRFA
jgi:hypothetical protein